MNSRDSENARETTAAVRQLFAGLRAGQTSGHASGQTRALARAVSLVEDGAPEPAELLRLSAMVSGEHRVVPAVLKTVATTGEGIGELLGVLDSLSANGKRASGVQAPAYLSRFGLEQGSADEPFSRGIEGAVLDHLGIAVRSIEASRGLYEALGVVVSGIEEVAQERVRVAMLAVGGSWIELLEATEADTAVGRFLAKRGEGLHHVALRVPDLTAAVERMKERGVRLVSERIQIGAGGHRYVFVHPQSANGVLLELVEAAAARGDGN